MESFGKIMPLDSSGKEVAGYIDALNEEFYIHLKYVNADSKEIYLKGCKKLQKVLNPVIDTLKQHLLKSNSVRDMLSEIQNALEKQIALQSLKTSSEFYIDYSTLLDQLNHCGWKRVHYISPDFHKLHLKIVDDFEREHILQLFFSEKFPNEAPKYDCDLPLEFEYKWLPGDTLASILDAFHENVLKFCEFWNYMDEIDSKTWVLEPEKPTRKDCKRRIAIASGVSLMLIINPSTPASVPTCHYLGPERVVESIRQKFNRNIHLWSEYDSILVNLQQILEIDFPLPSAAAKEDFCMECGICYSYQLEDAIPNISCEDPKCNKPFHHMCLYEYIRTLPNVRTSFNKLFGECPYCSSQIWCTIP